MFGIQPCYNLVSRLSYMFGIQSCHNLVSRLSYTFGIQSQCLRTGLGWEMYLLSLIPRLWSSSLGMRLRVMNLPLLHYNVYSYSSLYGSFEHTLKTFYGFLKAPLKALFQPFKVYLKYQFGIIYGNPLTPCYYI